VSTGIVLAAGASRRMGSPKALLELNGRSFLEILASLFVSATGSCIAVLGQDATRIHASVPALRGVRYVVNPDPDRGMLSSLQCALRTVQPKIGYVLFTPVDCPAIAPSTVRALLNSPPGKSILVPRHAGRRGHPVLCARSILDEFLRLPPASAPNEVIRRDESRIGYVEVDDPFIHRDADDPESYARLIAEARP
jgi:molybdenum cofactor cytidylyltransferase